MAFASGLGYPTPKVDVRAVVFRGEELLLVRERRSGRWTFPGGWADAGDTPSRAAERETLEESGYRVKAGKVLARARQVAPRAPAVDRLYIQSTDGLPARERRAGHQPRDRRGGLLRPRRAARRSTSTARPPARSSWPGPTSPTRRAQRISTDESQSVRSENGVKSVRAVEVVLALGALEEVHDAVGEGSHRDLPQHLEEVVRDHDPQDEARSPTRRGRRAGRRRPSPPPRPRSWSRWSGSRGAAPRSRASSSRGRRSCRTRRRSRRRARRARCAASRRRPSRRPPGAASREREGRPGRPSS